MSLRVEDLTPAQRRQILGVKPKPTRRVSEKCPGRCVCGQAFPTYGAAFERHSDEGGAGHRKWLVDL